MTSSIFRLMGLDKCSGPKPGIQADRVWAKPTTTRGGTVYLYKNDPGNVLGQQSTKAFAWVPAEAAPPMSPDHPGGWVRYYARSQDKQYVGFDFSESMSTTALDKADHAWSLGYSAPADKTRKEPEQFFYEGRLVPKHLVSTLRRTLEYKTPEQRRSFINGCHDLTDLDRSVLREMLHIGTNPERDASIIAASKPWTTAAVVNAMWDNAQSSTLTKKAPSIMTKIAQAAQTITVNNKTAVIAASYLEAGRVANSRITKLVAPRLPFMAKAYADTPLGRLVIANLAQVVAQQFRADNVALAKLTTAMVTSAYSEMLANLKIDELLDEILSDKKIVAAMTAAGDEPRD